MFPTLVKLVDDLIKHNRLMSVELVHDEVKVMGSLVLRAWAKQKANIFDPTQNHLSRALAVEGQFPALNDPHSQYAEADGYVIALAQIQSAIAVTAETPAATKRKPKRSMYIQDVCSALGMTSISNVGLMRREGWTI